MWCCQRWSKRGEIFLRWRFGDDMRGCAAMRAVLFLCGTLPLVAVEKALLISPPELVEAWTDYAELREDVSVEVVSTDQIAKEFKEGDLPEKIRLRVRKGIDEGGVKYVILGGDSSPEGGLVPDRDTFHKNMWGNDQDIPSDVFYLSPTNWDADGDGVFGEWEDDRDAITYPDGSVGIGRIPVRTKEDVENYGKKVLAYLATEEGGDLAMTCAVAGAYAKVHRSGSEFISQKWKEGEVKFLFNDFTSWDEEGKKGSYDLSPNNLSEQMNSGEVNKWHVHGHGLIDRWQLESDTKFSYENVDALKNGDRLPVITTVSCFTGQFDSEKDPCISEAMLRKEGGGAIAIVAPSREGKPHFHDPENDFPLMMREGKLDGTTETMTLFWVNALGEGKTTGLALAAAKKKLGEDAKKSATYHQGVCEINLLGDPSLTVK